jgi:ribosomal-protein-alanine N-acetyltransferase
LLDWRRSLPTLSGHRVTLRQIELTDAAALLDTMTSDQVARFISPPPAAIDGFARFIERMRHEQQRGTYVCFAVVPAGESTPVGLFQVRELEPGFQGAEWGFALSAPYWGTGLFVEAASLVATFAFDVLGAARLEARAAVCNGRGNGALRKLGAVQEAILRRAFFCRGEYLDLALWSILAADWRRTRARRQARVGVH